MAVDKKRKDRLSPPFLYVFRSARQDNAARDSSGNEAGGRVAGRLPVTDKMLRSEVSRDLANLMNCVNFESSTDLSEFPAVRKSILNYGLPDIAHRTVEELDGADIDGVICAVMQQFEPRIAAESVRVSRDRSVDRTEFHVRYLVDGDLVCQPLNIPVQFVADVDITTGKIQLKRL